MRGEVKPYTLFPSGCSPMSDGNDDPDNPCPETVNPLQESTLQQLIGSEQSKQCAALHAGDCLTEMIGNDVSFKNEFRKESSFANNVTPPLAKLGITSKVDDNKDIVANQKDLFLREKIISEINYLQKQSDEELNLVHEIHDTIRQNKKYLFDSKSNTEKPMENTGSYGNDLKITTHTIEIHDVENNELGSFTNNGSRPDSQFSIFGNKKSNEVLTTSCIKDKDKIQPSDPDTLLCLHTDTNIQKFLSVMENRLNLKRSKRSKPNCKYPLHRSLDLGTSDPLHATPSDPLHATPSVPLHATPSDSLHATPDNRELSLVSKSKSSKKFDPKKNKDFTYYQKNKDCTRTTKIDHKNHIRYDNMKIMGIPKNISFPPSVHQIAINPLSLDKCSTNQVERFKNNTIDKFSSKLENSIGTKTKSGKNEGIILTRSRFSQKKKETSEIEHSNQIDHREGKSNQIMGSSNKRASYRIADV